MNYEGEPGFQIRALVCCLSVGDATLQHTSKKYARCQADSFQHLVICQLSGRICFLLCLEDRKNTRRNDTGSNRTQLGQENLAMGGIHTCDARGTGESNCSTVSKATKAAS